VGFQHVSTHYLRPFRTAALRGVNYFRRAADLIVAAQTPPGRTDH
jgi:hypothetical protein